MPSSPMFPPRANAIATLITTDDFLPGAQTLLYSLKKTSKPTPKIEYPPETIVLVTPNVSTSTRNALCPTFCTRILQVEPIPFPSSPTTQEGKNDADSHVKSWNENCGLTKLHIFNLDVYDTILYIDADCLVVKDVGHLLKLGSGGGEEQQKRGLIAAAPDIFPPDKFNAGLLVIRPSQSIFTDLIKSSTTLPSYDGGDTGLLNAYYPNWFTSMPSEARLNFGYNAQRFLHSCTYEKQPNYWDIGVKGKGEEDYLHVIHFSSSPKPWEIQTEGNKKESAKAMLNEKDAQTISQSNKKMGKLEQMWKKSYIQSKNYAQRCEEDRLNKKRKEEEEKQKAASISKKQKSPPNKKDMHKLITKRYKELRKEGKMSVKEAMAAARAEYGADKEDERTPDAGSQVAAMFGMPM